MAASIKPVAQAFIALRAHDPEAVSAIHAAQRHLPEGAGLTRLRRWRLVELRGALPERAEVEDLLHRSTQFYNPSKEKCTVRRHEEDAVPVVPDEQVLLVTERGGERRPSAERWWRHETGERVEVREGLVWGLTFADGTDAARAAESLALATSRDCGLFANPHAQSCKLTEGAPPLGWLAGRTGVLRPRRKGRVR